jgi:hypothetical protein
LYNNTLKISTPAKSGTAPGDDQTPQVCILFYLIQNFLERRQGFAVHAVSVIRPVKGDGSDGLFFFIQDWRGAHMDFPFFL